MFLLSLDHWILESFEIFYHSNYLTALHLFPNNFIYEYNFPTRVILYLCNPTLHIDIKISNTPLHKQVFLCTGLKHSQSSILSTSSPIPVFSIFSSSLSSQKVIKPLFFISVIKSHFLHCLNYSNDNKNYFSLYLHLGNVFHNLPYIPHLPQTGKNAHLPHLHIGETATPTENIPLDL